MKSTRSRDRALAQWRIARQKGARRYILRNGLLPYGLLPASAVLIVACIFGGDGWHELFSTLVWSLMGICLLYGLISGTVLWTIQKRLYRKYE